VSKNNYRDPDNQPIEKVMKPLSNVYFNPEMFMEIVSLEDGGQAGLLIDLIEEYSYSYGIFTNKMQNSLLAGNFKDLNDAAHSLKSSSRLLGLERISEICLRMEIEASEGFCSPELFGMLIEARAPSLEAITEWVVKRAQIKKSA
jgi:HPt (histidine-containing phosphotransfer) domain-containing protein